MKVLSCIKAIYQVSSLYKGHLLGILIIGIWVYSEVWLKEFWFDIKNCHDYTINFACISLKFHTFKILKPIKIGRIFLSFFFQKAKPYKIPSRNTIHSAKILAQNDNNGELWLLTYLVNKTGQKILLKYETLKLTVQKNAQQLWPAPKQYRFSKFKTQKILCWSLSVNMPGPLPVAFTRFSFLLCMNHLMGKVQMLWNTPEMANCSLSGNMTPTSLYRGNQPYKKSDLSS